MKFTRDAAIWWVFIIGGGAGFVAGHFDKFPFLPKEYQGLVELVSFLASVIGGKLATSPLGLSPEAKLKEMTAPQPESTQPPAVP